MRSYVYPFTILIALASALESNLPASAADDAVVRFDLPPVAAAHRAESADGDETLVNVQLRLSSMIQSVQEPPVDQWIVRCQPRDARIRIADYAPRTETASSLATPIQVKTTEEESKAHGFSLDGAYGHTVRGTVGSDHAKKQINTLQFDRIAPLQAVTAAGTINRGRGVYFKLRWTPTQVLEGEKVFHLTLRVPAQWRAGLLDVSVVAHCERKSFTGWDRETKAVSRENFVVATYRQGDDEAAARAHALAEAEYALHSVAATHVAEVASLPSMLRHIAAKLDLDQDGPAHSWLPRLLMDRADPHLDKEISKLPMPIRVAVLEYAEIRDSFDTFNEVSGDRTVVARPAIE